jgi:hypothetical protein
MEHLILFSPLCFSLLLKWQPNSQGLDGLGLWLGLGLGLQNLSFLLAVANPAKSVDKICRQNMIKQTKGIYLCLWRKLLWSYKRRYVSGIRLGIDTRAIEVSLWFYRNDRLGISWMHNYTEASC